MAKRVTFSFTYMKIVSNAFVSNDIQVGEREGNTFRHRMICDSLLKIKSALNKTGFINCCRSCFGISKQMKILNHVTVSKLS